ncbi:hypothetical protein [Nocardia transvalensis]|uniref:hypothetical protein n=1 Tax=Nocardia transvalensis TaxID=37333 RepID=UPI00189416F5|nr:hypothetical protein [Nocardia transvalensis]MBF6333581.1 hypothetical protein [Nocardia transvalensis]
MPKKQSTAAKRARAAARSGQKFTTALRETATDPSVRVDMVVARRARWAADIRSRGLYLHARFPQRSVRGRLMFNDVPPGRATFLHLLYSLVLKSRPELRPVVSERAVAVGDLETIDAVFAPLDRAVRCFLAQEPHSVWQHQLRAHVEVLDEQSGPGWQTRQQLSGWYHQAMTWRPGVGVYGEPTRYGFPYFGACDILDAILVTTTGGYAPGSRVQLRDDRMAYVLHAQWWDERGGGPDGYVVMLEHSGGDFEVRADQIIGSAPISADNQIVRRAPMSSDTGSKRLTGKTVVPVQFPVSPGTLLIDLDPQGNATF